MNFNENNGMCRAPANRSSWRAGDDFGAVIPDEASAGRIAVARPDFLPVRRGFP